MAPRLLAVCCLIAAARHSAAQELSELAKSPARGGQAGDPGATHAQGGNMSIAVQIGYYDRDDSGDGNPFLDEDLTIIEPVVIFDHNVSDDFGYSIKLSFDNVSSASIDRLSNFPNQSGASGDTYFGGDFSFRHRLSDSSDVGYHVGFSKEYDYTSFKLGGKLAFETPDQNRKLTFSLDGFFDQIDIIRFDGSEPGSDDRTSVAGTVRWYQILSPTIHGEFGLTLSQQTGFLETAYNAVVVEDPMLSPNPNLANMARGLEITEELPDDRLRTAVFGRVRKLVRSGTAVELGGRYYSDDWGIDAFTLEPRLYQSLTDKLRLRLRYRYYQQSQSKYFEEQFLSAKEFRTQDSDLGDYDTNTIGLKFIWDKTQHHTFDIGVDFATRSDGLDHVFASIGWKHTF